MSQECILNGYASQTLVTDGYLGNKIVINGYTAINFEIRAIVCVDQLTPLSFLLWGGNGQTYLQAGSGVVIEYD